MHYSYYNGCDEPSVYELEEIQEDKMNREIKFRGKDRESWHYGDLVQEIRHNDNKLFDGTFTYIRNFEYKNGDYIGESFQVNPDTIGQYTRTT